MNQELESLWLQPREYVKFGYSSEGNKLPSRVSVVFSAYWTTRNSRLGIFIPSAKAVEFLQKMQALIPDPTLNIEPAIDLGLLVMIET